MLCQAECNGTLEISFILKTKTCICNELIGKRLCVCQVSTEGTGSRGQTGHSDNSQKCADFTFTSASDSSSLTDPNLIRRHLHERSKYTCKLCGSTFKNIDQLLHHETTHEGGRFFCPEADCQCSYVSNSGLKKHMDKFHKKLYRYRCGTCGRGYMDRSFYYDHISAHTGVKRHTCTICEIKFMNKTTLKKHVLHFHPNEAVNIL